MRFFLAPLCAGLFDLVIREDGGAEKEGRHWLGGMFFWTGRAVDCWCRVLVLFGVNVRLEMDSYMTRRYGECVDWEQRRKNEKLISMLSLLSSRLLLVRTRLTTLEADDDGTVATAEPKLGLWQDSIIRHHSQPHNLLSSQCFSLDNSRFIIGRPALVYHVVM